MADASETQLRLHAEWDQRLRLRAEGFKLRAEGKKLSAEGDKLWADAVLAAYGNITMKWSWFTEHGECHLDNGDVYGVDSNG